LGGFVAIRSNSDKSTNQTTPRTEFKEINGLGNGIAFALKVFASRNRKPKRRTMIQLTDGAIQAVRSAIAGAPEPIEGLRIAVETGGCAGYKYVMGLVAELSPEDIAVERDGVTIFVDPVSQPYLAGTTIDFVTAIEGSGFTFDNPNAESRCSCGKSFG